MQLNNMQDAFNKDSIIIHNFVFFFLTEQYI